MATRRAQARYGDQATVPGDTGNTQIVRRRRSQSLDSYEPRRRPSPSTVRDAYYVPPPLRERGHTYGTVNAGGQARVVVGDAFTTNNNYQYVNNTNVTHPRSSSPVMSTASSFASGFVGGFVGAAAAVAVSTTVSRDSSRRHHRDGLNVDDDRYLRGVGDHRDSEEASGVASEAFSNTYQQIQERQRPWAEEFSEVRRGRHGPGANRPECIVCGQQEESDNGGAKITTDVPENPRRLRTEWICSHCINSCPGISLPSIGSKINLAELSDICKQVRSAQDNVIRTQPRTSRLAALDRSEDRRREGAFYDERRIDRDR